MTLLKIYATTSCHKQTRYSECGFNASLINTMFIGRNGEKGQTDIAIHIYRKYLLTRSNFLSTFYKHCLVPMGFFSETICMQVYNSSIKKTLSLRGGVKLITYLPITVQFHLLRRLSTLE